jgi:hypothetical protein
MQCYSDNGIITNIKNESQEARHNPKRKKICVTEISVPNNKLQQKYQENATKYI